MRIIGLDPSKRSTGLAGWDGESSHPVILSKQLGCKLTLPGEAFARLHGVMDDLNMVIGGADVIYCEEPLLPSAIQRHTTFDTVLMAYGLFGHAQSFAVAKGIRFHAVHQMTWRKHFLGSMKRGTKKQQFKDLALERARQLGFRPRNDDEADAIGVMDWGCEVERVIPPWRANEVLRPPLGVS